MVGPHQQKVSVCEDIECFASIKHMQTLIASLLSQLFCFHAFWYLPQPKNRSNFHIANVFLASFVLLIPTHCVLCREHELCIAYTECHDQALVGDKTPAFWLMDAEMCPLCPHVLYS